MTFYPGEQVRIQLAPDGTSFRYYFDGNGQWYDLGYGGPWTTAIITANEDDIMSIDYMAQNDIKSFNFPLEGHPAFYPELLKLEGWPKQRLRIDPVPKCDCGCESAKDGGTHYSWCSKQTFLNENPSYQRLKC